MYFEIIVYVDHIIECCLQLQLSLLIYTTILVIVNPPKPQCLYWIKTLSNLLGISPNKKEAEQVELISFL